MLHFLNSQRMRNGHLAAERAARAERAAKRRADDKARAATRAARLAEAARGNAERYLGDVCEEGMSADALFDEAYTLAFDGAVDAGFSAEEARDAAQYYAQCLAQP